MRKLIAFGIFLVFAVVAGNIVASNFKHQPTSTSTATGSSGSGSSSRSSPPVSAGSNKTSGSSGDGEDGSEGSSVDPAGPEAAAKAAGEAMDTALFMPRSQADAVVKTVVYPSQVSTQQLLLKYKRLALATDGLHYRSWSDARQHANYDYQALMFHLDRRNSRNAQVTLFGVMSWNSPENNQGQQVPYCWPDLRVVYMRYTRVRVNGKDHLRWLLVDQTAPQSNQFPAPFKRDAQVSCEQAVQRFQSHLKGFKNL